MKIKKMIVKMKEAKMIQIKLLLRNQKKSQSKNERSL